MHLYMPQLTGRGYFLSSSADTPITHHYYNCIVLEWKRAIEIKFCALIRVCLPVPVVARSKTYVCGCLPTEIVVSNPTGGMDVCLLRALCVVR
jgi:hypothetical protein